MRGKNGSDSTGSNRQTKSFKITVDVTHAVTQFVKYSLFAASLENDKI